MPPYFMRSGGMCCSCFLCVSAVCFFLKIPLCFLPLNPPGVRHFTMEPSWKSIFFPCIFLTISLLPTFLSGSKNFLLGGLVAPSFFISGILLPTVNNSPMKGGLLRVTEPQNCYAGYPCFLNTFLRVLQKLYAGFLHCYSPKAQF